MVLVLAPYEGDGIRLPNGSLENAFKPILSEFSEKFGSVDLRVDPTVVTGFALLELPNNINDPRLIKIGNNEDSGIAPVRLAELEAALEIDLTGVEDISDFLKVVLIDTGKVKTNKRKKAKRVIISGRVWLNVPDDTPAAEFMDPSDDFNRADEDPLGNGDWTTVTSNVDLAIVSNVAVNSQPNNDAASVYSNATFDDDQFAEVTLAPASGAPDCSATVRVAPSAWSYYMYNAWDGFNHLYKYVNGSITEIGSQVASPDPTTGDVIKTEVEGSDLTGFINDVEVITGTDTSLTSGNAGMQIYDTSGLDNFNSGNLTAPRDASEGSGLIHNSDMTM